jgi:hypothetical protein
MISVPCFDPVHVSQLQLCFRFYQLCSVNYAAYRCVHYIVSSTTSLKSLVLVARKGVNISCIYSNNILQRMHFQYILYYILYYIYNIIYFRTKRLIKDCIL